MPCFGQTLQVLCSYGHVLQFFPPRLGYGQILSLFFKAQITPVKQIGCDARGSAAAEGV